MRLTARPLASRCPFIKWFSSLPRRGTSGMIESERPNVGKRISEAIEGTAQRTFPGIGHVRICSGLEAQTI